MHSVMLSCSFSLKSNISNSISKTVNKRSYNYKFGVVFLFSSFATEQKKPVEKNRRLFLSKRLSWWAYFRKGLLLERALFSILICLTFARDFTFDVLLVHMDYINHTNWHLNDTKPNFNSSCMFYKIIRAVVKWTTSFQFYLKKEMSRLAQLLDFCHFLWRAVDWDCEEIKAISSIKSFTWMNKNI